MMYQNQSNAFTVWIIKTERENAADMMAVGNSNGQCEYQGRSSIQWQAAFLVQMSLQQDSGANAAPPQ